MLRIYIKWIGGSNLGEDSDGGFSYIISSWLMEEGRKPTAMTLYITNFCPTSSKKKNIYIYIGVFSGGLLQHFIGIAILTRFGEAC